jgi:hypothetical protein
MDDGGPSKSVHLSARSHQNKIIQGMIHLDAKYLILHTTTIDAEKEKENCRSQERDRE